MSSRTNCPSCFVLSVAILGPKYTALSVLLSVLKLFQVQNKLHEAILSGSLRNVQKALQSEAVGLDEKNRVGTAVSTVDIALVIWMYMT